MRSLLVSIAGSFPVGGVLGELYGGAVETRVANDVEDLLKWIEQEDDQPRTIIESAFQPDHLDRLTSRLSAAHKGIMC